jgi:hypothetical protein
MTRHDRRIGGAIQEIATYTYDGDGHKRSEKINSALMTLVWDGDDYLQSRS